MILPIRNSITVDRTGQNLPPLLKPWKGHSKLAGLIQGADHLTDFRFLNGPGFEEKVIQIELTKVSVIAIVSYMINGARLPGAFLLKSSR